MKYALHLIYYIIAYHMKFLFPHRYKKIGVVAAPLGFVLWILMQRGYVTRILTYILREESATTASPHRMANIMVASIGFFSFLGGMYLIAFSKESVEDEMVQRTRLDSFQFAALVQIIVTILGFLSILFAGEPQKEGILLFFAALLLLFWLSFIARFNYILHVKLTQ